MFAIEDVLKICDIWILTDISMIHASTFEWSIIETDYLNGFISSIVAYTGMAWT